MSITLFLFLNCLENKDVRLDFSLLGDGALAVWAFVGGVGVRGGLRPGHSLGQPLPLIDMGTTSYLGFSGGLYPNGDNVPPADHANEGSGRANQIEPLNVEGEPDPAGRIVLLSIGMSNTAQEFCEADYWANCTPESFGGQSLADPQVNHATLTLINGARGGQDVTEWQSPRNHNYQIIRQKLSAAGLSEAQVQVVWLKAVNNNSTANPSLPDLNADAFLLLSRLADVVRTLKLKYPNLQQIFLSSRIYGGYSTLPTSPEPYAYETAFAVKWLIESQIEQMATGQVNPQTGDLDYNTVTAWLAWGDYLWANGSQPRSDGLVWLESDFEADGLHPSPAGIEKVGQLLLDFFKNSPFTTPWFVNDLQPTPTPPAPRPSRTPVATATPRPTRLP